METKEQSVLVLQGGGALGAYQAGAYEQLSRKGFEPHWVAGISIGSITAAIICGNPPEQRVAHLRKFWNKITADLTAPLWFGGDAARQLYTEAASAMVTLLGVPGFFRPKSSFTFSPFAANQTLSYYDTSPLAATLAELVDFDYLNDHGPRLSVGAVDIETGNFAYFDSAKIRIRPEHIMASGALPPGFPPVEIDGRLYWDGGLVSNTPLQYVMENAGTDPVCIFQIDLFSATGKLPGDLAAVAQRQKDIQFSSRTRLTTDRYRHMADMRAAACRLRAKLPKDIANDPDMALLCDNGPACPTTLVHLIHRKENFETQSKDYEFSRLTMTEHWAAGIRDVKSTLAHKAFKTRKIGAAGLQVFDLGGVGLDS